MVFWPFKVKIQKGRRENPVRRKRGYGSNILLRELLPLAVRHCAARGNTDHGTPNEKSSP
jgi:hypothetical protein